MTAKLLKVREAAQRLSAGTSTVYDLIRAGRLPCVSIGPTKGRRIREQDLEQFIRDNTDNGLPKGVKFRHLA